MLAARSNHGLVPSHFIMLMLSPGQRRSGQHHGMTKGNWRLSCKVNCMRHQRYNGFRGQIYWSTVGVIAEVRSMIGASCLC
jgi:hypothetical protein